MLFKSNVTFPNVSTLSAEMSDVRALPFPTYRSNENSKTLLIKAAQPQARSGKLDFLLQWQAFQMLELAPHAPCCMQKSVKLNTMSSSHSQVRARLREPCISQIGLTCHLRNCDMWNPPWIEHKQWFHASDRLQTKFCRWLWIGHDLRRTVLLLNVRRHP